MLIGAGESTLETRLESFINFTQKLKLLHILKEEELSTCFKQLKLMKENFFKLLKSLKLMEPYIVSEDGALIEEVIVHILQQLNFHISFAESCTGGLLASKIISPGASAVINEFGNL